MDDPVVRYMNRREYFQWARSISTGELLDFFLAAVELEKHRELPVGVLGYDEANNILFVSKDGHGRLN